MTIQSTIFRNTKNAAFRPSCVDLKNETADQAPDFNDDTVGNIKNGVEGAI